MELGSAPEKPRLGCQVQNEEVAACAKPSCRDCNGKGWVKWLEATKKKGVLAMFESLCECAERRFKMRYGDRVAMHDGKPHWVEWTT